MTSTDNMALDDIGEITGRLPEDPWNDLYERFLLAATENGRAPGLSEAREQYFRVTGEAHAEDPDYAERMSLFLDWFAFSWRGPGGRTLAQQVFEAGESELAVLAEHRHSLFVYLKGEGPALRFKDLVSGEKIEVQAGGGSPFFLKDAPFEARLVTSEGAFHLAGPVCLHPAAAAKPVGRHLKRLLKETKDDPGRRAQGVEALLLALRELRVRARQYGHLDPAKIYAEGLEKLAGGEGA